jgi:hypothetical protein
MEGKRRREDPKNGITKLDSTPYLLLSLSLSLSHSSLSYRHCIPASQIYKLLPLNSALPAPASHY